MLATLGTNGRTLPVTVVGPKGVRAAIETVFNASETPSDEPTTPITIIELDTDAPTTLAMPDCGGDPALTLAIDPGVDITAVPIEHRVPCVGYVISERLRPGPLDAKRARALGAQGQQMGALKAGKDVTLDDGRVVRAADVTAAPTPGRRMCVIQDTHDPTRFRELFAGCDVMVHEATYDHLLHDKAIANGHSTARMAAQFAVDTRARNLILTHFSSRYDKETLARERGGCARCDDGETPDRVVFQPPKVWSLAQAAAAAAAGDGEAEKEKEKLKKMSVFDLRDEAEAVMAQSDAPARVHLATDFRMFEVDRSGAWHAVEEADVDLSKMF
jgi:ribonuclease Z